MDFEKERVDFDHLEKEKGNVRRVERIEDGQEKKKRSYYQFHFHFHSNYHFHYYLHFHGLIINHPKTFRSPF